MKKYEYKRLIEREALTEGMLNIYGQSGWLLCGMLPCLCTNGLDNEMNYLYIFARELYEI
jgi:hypothetical protein